MKSFSSQLADAVIAGEILEHIEKPDSLLRKLYKASKPNALMFVTTVAYTANIDHIYLFESVSEIRKLIEEQSWFIDDELVLPVFPGQNPEIKKTPVNYAAVLRKYE